MGSTVVSFNEWVLAFHVLGAFAYVAGMVLLWVLIIAVRKIDTPEATIRMEPVGKVGNAAVGVGAVGTIVLGIWLAFAVDSYAIWDTWIIAALVLWAVAGALGQRTGVAYMRGMTKLPAGRPDGGEDDHAPGLKIMSTRISRTATDASACKTTPSVVRFSARSSAFELVSPAPLSRLAFVMPRM